MERLGVIESEGTQAQAFGVDSWEGLKRPDHAAIYSLQAWFRKSPEQRGTFATKFCDGADLGA
jgi:hypothetical protein